MSLNQHEVDASHRVGLLRADDSYAQENDAYWRARSRPKLQALDPAGEVKAKLSTPPPSMAVLALVTASVASSWVLTTELASAAQDSGFGSCVLLYASTSLLSLLGLVPEVRRARLVPLARSTPGNGGRGGFLASIGPAGFLVLWMGANLSFLAALTIDSPSTVTAVFSTNPVFVYGLSIVALSEKIDNLGLAAAALAAGGVALTALSAKASKDDDADDDGDASTAADSSLNDDATSSSSSTLSIGAAGCLLALSSALLAALYKVLFFRRYHNGVTPAQVGHFLARLGGLCLLTAWLPVLALHEAESPLGAVPWPPQEHAKAWWLAGGQSCASAAFHVAVNLGVAKTYPLFASIGTLLGIPLAVVADCARAGGFQSSTCHSLTSAQPLAGAALIAVAFGALLWRGAAATAAHKEAVAVAVAAASSRGPVVAAAPAGASLISSLRTSDGMLLASEEGDDDYDDDGDDKVDVDELIQTSDHGVKPDTFSVGRANSSSRSDHGGRMFEPEQRPEQDPRSYPWKSYPQSRLEPDSQPNLDEHDEGGGPQQQRASDFNTGPARGSSDLGWGARFEGGGEGYGPGKAAGTNPLAGIAGEPEKSVLS